MHTADWPDEFDPRGKDIAVIGNGASAVQCLAKICSGRRLTHEITIQEHS